MAIRHEKKGEMTFVGIKVVCPFSELSVNVPKAWSQLKGKLNDINHIVDENVAYGIFPEMDHIAPDLNRVTYWVAVEVGEFFEVPAVCTMLTLPKQNYAVDTCVGPLENIALSYNRLGDWLKESGHEKDANSFGFERYHLDKQNPFKAENDVGMFYFDIFEPFKMITG